MRSYKITRIGKITNEGLCGRDEETELWYEVDIEVTNLTLDKDKFMVDHQLIHDTIWGRLRFATSCEIACEGALEAIHSQILNEHKDRMSPKSVKVQVGMVDGDAYFTVTDN